MSSVKTFDFGIGANKEQENRSNRFKQFSALVIDDFDSFRLTVTRMLSQFGIRDVDAAAKATYAMRSCQERSYDIILCDYNLGGGQNGQQLLEELRQRKMLKSSCLFIMVSAESSKSVVLAAYDYRPDAYLTKPLTQQTLNQRLSKLLAERLELAPAYKAMDMGHWQKAIELCMRLVEKKPRYKNNCLKLLADIYFRLEDYQGAKKVCASVQKTHPVEWAKLGLCRAKINLNEVDDVLPHLNEIIASNPLCMEAYDLKVEALSQLEKRVDMQKTLESAVEVSPLAIVRQRTLGEVAMDNNDTLTASNAFHKTVRLSDNSYFDSPENHINFGRCTAAMFAFDDSRAREMSKEAIKSLETLANKFGHEPERDMQGALACCQLHYKTGNKTKADELLNNVEIQMEELAFEPSIDTYLDMISAYSGTEKIDKANRLLGRLVEENQHNEAVLKQLDRMLDEPVSASARKELKDTNRRGIKLFDDGEYDLAINCFTDARRMFPKNVAVALNLSQCMLSAMEEFGYRQDYMDDAALVLDSLSWVPNNHKQIDRLKQLKQKAHELSRRKI